MDDYFTGQTSPLIECYDKNYHQVDCFKSEIQKDCDDIRSRVKSLRQKIDSKIHRIGQPQGFLLGQVDDYFDAFDLEIRQLNHKLEHDKHYWLQQKELLYQEQEKVAIMIESFKTSLQSKMLQFGSVQEPFDISKH